MVDQEKLDELLGLLAWEAGKKVGKQIAKAIGKEIKFFDPYLGNERDMLMFDKFAAAIYYQLDAIKNKTK